MPKRSHLLTACSCRESSPCTSIPTRKHSHHRRVLLPDSPRASWLHSLTLAPLRRLHCVLALLSTRLLIPPPYPNALACLLHAHAGKFAQHRHFVFSPGHPDPVLPSGGCPPNPQAAGIVLLQLASRPTCGQLASFCTVDNHPCSTMPKRGHSCFSASPKNGLALPLTPARYPPRPCAPCLTNPAHGDPYAMVLSG
jgi:hypothetical protein